MPGGRASSGRAWKLCVSTGCIHNPLARPGSSGWEGAGGEPSESGQLAPGAHTHLVMCPLSEGSGLCWEDQRLRLRDQRPDATSLGLPTR